MGRALAFFMVLVGTGLAIFLASRYVIRNLRDREAAIRWEEFRKAAAIVGDPLSDNPKLAAGDFDAQAGRLIALHDSNLAFKNPELSKVWAEIETNTSRGLLILEKIGEIDEKIPSDTNMLGKLVKTGVQQDEAATREFLGTATDWISNQIDKHGREEKFREMESNLDVSISHLKGIADGLTRRKLSFSPTVRYFPAWEGTFDADEVDVENTSHKSLENAIVFVSVRMDDGSSTTHLHYVPQWKDGARLGALYPYKAAAYVNAQTGRHPENVDVDIYTVDGATRASYALTPDEWGRIVQSYCSHATFDGQFLAAFDDSTGHHPAGFQFLFRGLPALPVKSVEYIFRSSNNEVLADDVEVFQDGTKLEPGHFTPLSTYRSAKLDVPDPPGHIDYVLRYSGTNNEQKLHLY